MRTLDLEVMGIKKFQAVTTNQTDEMVYELESIELAGQGEMKMYYTMKLVKGIDYTDGGDGPRGWVGAENFTEGVQEITFTVFPLTESVDSQLEYNDLRLLNPPQQ